MELEVFRLVGSLLGTPVHGCVGGALHGVSVLSGARSQERGPFRPGQLWLSLSGGKYFAKMVENSSCLV